MTPTPPDAQAPGSEALRRQLQNTADHWRKCLAAPGWTPRRSHIEDCANAFRMAANNVPVLPPRPEPSEAGETPWAQSGAHVPPDVQQFGERHGIPEFANATYRAGWIDGYRFAGKGTSPPPIQPSPDTDEELIAELRTFGKAFPEDIFPPLSDEERAAIKPSTLSRISAEMGRHFAQFADKAAGRSRPSQRRGNPSGE